MTTHQATGLQVAFTPHIASGVGPAQPQEIAAITQMTFENNGDNTFPTNASLH